MYKKKVMFYTALLQDLRQNDMNVTDNMKTILGTIFKDNGFKNGNITTLEFTASKEPITLDVLKEDNDYLFCRVGRKKDIQDLVLRNIATRGSSYVLEGDDTETKQLEACTYFLIDYKTGIISFLIGNDAPRPSCIPYMLDELDRYHLMTINSIVNPENVNALLKKGSTLSRVKYTFLVPDETILSSIGFTPEQVLAFKDTELHEAEIVLKSKPRKKITTDENVISKIINSFKGTSNQDKVRITGKEPQKSQQDYDFLEGRLGYSVELKETKTENERKTRVSKEELEAEMFIKIRNLYLNNKKQLLYFANKIVE